MKNIKNFTLGILGATILSLGLYSCSNDDVASDVRTNNTIEKNTTSSYELEKAYITLDNKMYIHENGFYEKYVEGEYEYDFVISDIDYELLQENRNSYTIINNFDTSEVIEITNLVGNSNGTFSFDIQADGIYISDVNFSYEANFSSKYVTNSLLGLPVPGSPVWKFVEIIAPVVIEKILEDKPDPNLAACREAMNSLNCGNNTNPYMEYIGGNWFTKSSCNVGCR